MRPRYFTVQEANALLPEIKPLVGKLLEKRAKVVQLSKTLEPIFAHAQGDFGGPEASTLVNEFDHIENLVDQIQSFGCVIKSLDAGLLDFLTLRNGRDVYLCWRYGEATITHFHELHDGFRGRQQL